MTLRKGAVSLALRLVAEITLDGPCIFGPEHTAPVSTREDLEL